MTASSLKNPARTRELVRVSCILFICLIGFTAFFSGWWYVYTYGRIGFDSIMFTLTGNLNGVNSEHLISYLIGGALPSLACTALVGLGLWWLRKKRHGLPRGTVLLSAALSLALTVQAAFNVDLVDFLITGIQKTTLYEDCYADPETTAVTFPEEKRNLVYIILESMETSYLSTAQGGGMAENLIPQLYALAQSNVNFSHNTDVGGYRDAPGTSWTMGSLVAQSGGIPLKNGSGSSENEESQSVVLPGVYTLSNILQTQGYRQAMMVGSDGDFGGRKGFYLSHGVDQFYDLYTAREEGFVAADYYNNFWGIEDSLLYEYAKEKLTELSAGSGPFAFTMLTVDTHSPSGYTCDLCQSTYEDDYANAIACADRQLAAFLAWLQQQDFYENTTVVIVGDHSSMNNGFFVRNVEDGYVRHIYNCFLNAAAEPVSTENRQFSAMDLFPTTLAALGCTIEGDRLGLGTNLFSAEPTLMEQLGYEALCRELNKRSDFYKEHFFKEP